jgi:hypothetical protein
VLEDVARHLRRQIDSICIVASHLDCQVVLSAVQPSRVLT